MLRVDQGKIDVIMNLVAELIVAKNSLNYLADLAENKHGSRAMAREIKDAYAVFDRITQGLQLGVMSVRMTPVSQMLQRFPRLVRDLSRALGKKVELAIEGEDTEADKNVLESLADPLIHIVRNCLDHGLETPAERLAAGKPETGVVRISARHESDFVVIEVSDDGRGVDIARVRAKAIKVGVITSERAEQMSEQETANLIFLPGFSTKDEVSDLSGRGVGMDVVRSTVVKAGGEVALRTRAGQGSTVVIRLPLTMAVTRIVTVDCNGRLFGIPMDLIAETVRVPQTSIRRIKNAEAFVLRDTIIPVARLAERLGLGAGAPQGRRRSRDGRARRGRARRRRRRWFSRASRGGRQATVRNSGGPHGLLGRDAARRWPSAVDPRSAGVAVMPFRVEDGVVSLEGHCSVEEAPDLFQALLALEAPTIDLEKAESLHTAVAQVLIASRGKLRNSTDRSGACGVFRFSDGGVNAGPLRRGASLSASLSLDFEPPPRRRRAVAAASAKTLSVKRIVMVKF